MTNPEDPNTVPEKEAPAVSAENDDLTPTESAAAAETTEAAAATDATETTVAADSAETAEDSDAAETAADIEAAEAAETTKADAAGAGKVKRAVALTVVLCVLLAAVLVGAGFLGWKYYSGQTAETARIETVQVAKDATVKLLSYKPETVEEELTAAADLLSGGFRDSYTELTNDVVIPGAKEQSISAVANVPAAASMSAESDRAEVLVFVNQTVIVGDGAPTATASSVKVTLEKVDGDWRISGFDPV
ncbi:hypothetical protein [[Mycobacterium] burgundiense]|uniref:Mce-associated membrane protein n=1 Tax=[Mycobacterium] burgundiense TaxID=3064286 RepID=A0ABM9LFA4_9MYCO|nr:hypothetical protein [Mycolicibacterium sp. MU0053]CAJ1498037.1 hypothetical protein MU0053_001058 [Mycolicibacterium sp. MU0053]